jgi:heat shock protein HslJ
MRAFIQSVGVLIVGAAALQNGCTPSPQDRNAASDHHDAEYVIDGRRVRLSDGISETEAAPGSASSTVTRSFGNEVHHDLNGDGREDVVFLLTQEPGGTGTFYYVVAAVAADEGFTGSHGLLLGDRIAPQDIEIGANHIVTVSYADRGAGESFATPPTQAKSIRLLLDPETMQFGEVAQDFEGEANPAMMTLGMKPWVWVNVRYDDGHEILPKQANAFTLTFGADGQFSASTDCNRIGGTYSAVDDQLTFSGIFATEMFCEGSQESDFSAVLTHAARYRFTTRGQLILELEPERGAAEFR